MKVSVVVPVYNSQKYIKDTIESVLNQSGVSIEVIVIDDCSNDGTGKIIQSIANGDDRVRIIQTPFNSGGPAVPRNLGIKKAQYEWIALCDADDVWHPEKLKIQISLAELEQADLVCSAIKDFEGDKVPSFTCIKPSGLISSNTLSYWQMILKNRIATSSVLCRKDIISSIKFSEERALVAVEDYDLWLRLMEYPALKAIRISLPLVAYRRISGSLSSNKLHHAFKVMLVIKHAAKRNGWLWVYPIVKPLIFSCYVLMSIYWRVLKKSL